MTEQKKLFVITFGQCWDRDDPVEIKDEQEAIDHSTKTGAIAFQTYEVPFANVGGKDLTGDPENYSKRHYAGVDKIYTNQEVIDIKVEILNAMMAGKSQINDDIMIKVRKDVIKEYKQNPSDTFHIVDRGERPGVYIELEPDVKAFDSNGKQIWPQPSEGNTVKPNPGPSPSL